MIGFVSSDLLGVSQEAGGEFGLDCRQVVLLAVGFHQLQVSDDQVSEEFNEYWVVPVNLNFQILDQLLKHVLQHSEFYLVVHREDLDRNGLVNGKDLLNGWAAVSHEDSGGFLELAL